MRKDWAAASKAYNAVVALQDMKHDPYARVGLATIHLYSMPHQQLVIDLPTYTRHCMGHTLCAARMCLRGCSYTSHVVGLVRCLCLQTQVRVWF